MTTITETTADATQAVIDTLREAGARPSGLSESGEGFDFIVRYQGEDFTVTVTPTATSEAQCPLCGEQSRGCRCDF